MTCAMLASDLVEVARGTRPTDSQRLAVDRHVRECPACAARFERERALSADLRRLAEDTIATAVDPDREQALLAAFDAAWARPRRPTWRPAAWGGVIAAIAATIAWAVWRVPAPARVTTAGTVATAPARSNAPTESAALEATAAAASDARKERARSSGSSRVRRPASAPRAGVPETTPFVLWPGADDLATFESGQLVRIELPASTAVSMGLTPRSNAPLVRADVVMDQDGYARAVRLVP
jgi:hypothetical protein